MEIEFSRDEIIGYIKLEFISKISLVKTKITSFGSKYDYDFNEFKGKWS